MRGIFVTGTDTGVGKTIITGLLARYLSDKGHNVITQKWIETGSNDKLSLDVRLHLKIMQRSKGELKDYIHLLSPYTFKTPSSPHLASRIEKRTISPDKIIKSFKSLMRSFEFVIVEGVGGALVPFNKKNLVIDIVKRLDLPVLVVAQNKLGAINQTLLTVEALKRREIKILGVVFNNLKNQDKRIIRDNPLIIKALSKEKIFGALPWRRGYGGLYEEFIPIGLKIYRMLKYG